MRRPQQAIALVAEGKADLVFLAREMPRNPFWAPDAADAVGETASSGRSSICERLEIIRQLK